MAATLPPHEGTFGHGATGCVGNAAKRGIEIGFGLVATSNEGLKGLMETLFLMVVELDVDTKAPIFAQVGFDTLPCEFFAQVGVQAVEVARIFFSAHTLMAEQVGVEFIRATSQNKTARLVVGRDHNERLFGVFLVESDSLANGAVHINDLMDHGGGIVGVAGIVYFASFHHQKEALFAF